MSLITRLINRLSRPPDAQSSERMFIPHMQAGMNVTHDTALTYGAVWRAVNYIAGQLATMPWRVFEQDGEKTTPKPGHPVDKILFVRPNFECTPFIFKQTLMSHVLTWGNGYAEIVRDAANRPSAMFLISPDRVRPYRDENGDLLYEINNASGGRAIARQDQIFHVHGLGFDGVSGYSVISYMARSVGLGMAVEEFGASFFANGTSTSGVLQHPGNVGEGALQNLRESWEARYRGPHNAHRPVILEEGMEWKTTSIPPDDAQFLETREFSVDEIARWYGVPPHIIGSMKNATFSNIEEQNTQVVNQCLSPWAITMEEEANFKLFPERQQGKMYTRINFGSLLRGDLESRTKYYDSLWNKGVLSANQILNMEDMNPIGPDGDKRFVQLNMTTLDKAGEEPESAPQPVPEIEPPEDDDDDDLEEPSAKIVRRERFRLQDAANRYQGDRKGFLNWMTAFFNQHMHYIAKVYGAVDTSHAIDAHITSARLHMLSYFDDGVEYPMDALKIQLLDMVKVYANN